MLIYIYIYIYKIRFVNNNSKYCINVYVEKLIMCSVADNRVCRKLKVVHATLI